MFEQAVRKRESYKLLQLVSFQLGGEEFGIDILKVKEIIRPMIVAKMPNAAHFVEGVINLRGKVVPIIDLRNKLGMTKKEHDLRTRIIVVDILEKTTGFIVDAVNEVLRIPSDITETPPEIVMGINSEFIDSVGKLQDRLLILIDLEKILSESEKYSLKN